MATKDYGSGVSGYLDPEGRNWETTAFQQAKPVLDKELNLVQDTEQLHEQRLRQQTFPSGWVSDDYLNTSDSVSAIFTQSVTANELEVPQDLLAFVNGWRIRVASTNATATNLLDLGAGPAGAGSNRTDLVILEVWRRRLDAASVSTDGKSPAGRIWLNGNVKIDAADDVALNFADDIEDATAGIETTKRVQIQYRLRVVQGVDIFSNPQGLDDPVVVANSVPAAPAAPDGVATVFTYTNQSAVGDSGLWRAGDGSPANTLGTVDGYMYGIPLMAVVRRNTTAFDKNTNHNGGVASPGPSDRPDGLFHDIIVDRDIIDLRRGVSPSGWNYQEILDKNFNWLFDNVIRTEITTTAVGGGVQGNTVLTADEIGITNAHGGDSVTTGDTPGAVFIGEFDAARRHFSDRAIIETIVVAYTPADGSGGGPNWANNDTITIDFTSLPIHPYAAFNWASFAPSDVVCLGLATEDVSGTKLEGIEFIGTTAAENRAQIADDYVLSGLGAVPIGSLTLDIGTVPTGITDETLYIRLLVMYPTGVGLSRTPTDEFGAGASVSINNPGQLPAGSPILFSAIENEDFDFPHRELFLTYATSTQSISYSAPATGQLEDVIVFPERVLSVSQIEVDGGGAYGGSITISPSGYVVELDPATLTASEGEATVDYVAVRPFPQNDEQITIYYETRAPQTTRDALLPSTLNVIPRYISTSLVTMTSGSGSQDEAFPFPTQYVQQPGVYPTSGGTYEGDHELESSAEVTLENVRLTTGHLRLPVLVGYVPNPQEATFERTGGDIDSEGRSFYKEVPTSAYIPNAFSEPLKAKQRHRTMLPMLAELAADSTVGRKGQLVMLVFGAIHSDAPSSTDPNSIVGDNSIAFDTDLSRNTTSVSVYHIKGHLLNRQS